MHLKINISILFLLTSIVLRCQPSEPYMTAEQYIEKYKDDAIKEMLLFNIPASITLAQGMLESANGNSDLAVYANNHFGIKCHAGWDGPTFIKDDDAKDECFRKYPSALDSYTDHSNFLKTRSRYAPLFELKRTDYKGWAKGLHKVGYATDPKYTRRLLTLIEDYELFKYDKTDERTPAQLKQNTEMTGQVKPIVKKTETQKPAKTQATAQRHVLRPVEQFRFINYVIIKPGDSFSKIAQETDKDVWQLCKFNDLQSTDKLIAGERLYLQPKRRNAKEPYHVVKKGETMRSISQLYAIKLKSLYKKNRMRPGEEPKVGETLYLQHSKKTS
jgi:LysM repeat protein